MDTIIHIHEKIIEQCKNGNRKAQGELYELYCKDIFNTCYRLLLNKQEAEDMMQNTFITAFEKIKQLKEISHFRPWLKRIAANKCIDYFRNKKIVFYEPIDYQMESEALNDDIYNEDDENLLLKVKDSIARLPEGYRLIINLHLFEDLDFPAIAQMLHIQESTVRSQYCRAKEKIRTTVTNFKTNSL